MISPYTTFDNSSAFRQLELNSTHDALWTVENFALGETNETRTINVAGNSVSSSFLDMLPAHLEIAPNSKYVASEKVSIRRLEDVFGDYVPTGEKVMLKSDTQGYERNVLLGSGNVLSSIDLVLLELSLRPLYAGDLSVTEAIELMEDFSFVPVSLEPGFTDITTGSQLQANIIFQKVA